MSRSTRPRRTRPGTQPTLHPGRRCAGAELVGTVPARWTGRYAPGLIAVAVLAGCGGPTEPEPDPIPETRTTDFGFLVGVWNVASSYDDGSGVETSSARARFRSDLGGRVIKEQWVGTRGGDGAEMIAMVLESTTVGSWIVARADGSAGTFDVGSGRFTDNEIQLVSSTGSGGDEVLVRETFSDIAAESFSWRAERSEDDGATWVEYWGMEYSASDDTTPLAPPAVASGCAEPEYREFDFWEGDWVVGSSSSNDLRSLLGGCVLEENWGSPTGTGTSFNMYDPRSGLWNQVWTDTDGVTLLLSGGLDGDRMIMSGTYLGVPQRITWIPLVNGDVRQRGESSSDGGTTWTISYDLVYTLR